MQKKRCEKSPVFVLDYDGVRVERADPMQNLGIIPIADGDFEKENDRVQHNKDENGRRVSELTGEAAACGFARYGN